MLTKEFLIDALVGQVPEIQNEEQVVEGDGMDAILDLLMNMRTVQFPAVVLESRSSGSIQLVEGPVDTYTESLWVMEQLGRSESEAEIYQEARMLALSVLRRLLDEYKKGEPQLMGWDSGRILYMKRAGGQNARGWEVVLTFHDNFSLLD